jgi:predicted alpha/beta superfamily hydrolase
MSKVRPVTLWDTEFHTLSSSHVGDSFTIRVALPTDYAETDKTYPVVYLLDADVLFGLVTETARLLQFGGEIPDCFIVGIGYPDPTQHLGLRTRDLTPVPDDEGSRAWLAKMSEGREVPIAFRGCGGAEQFLAFLRQELMPYLCEQYRIDPDDTVLAGDSLGGLFALYALFHQPQAFARYIIGSPSIYYGDAITFDYEAAYAAAHDDLPATVFLSAGALEAIYEPAFAAMLSNVARLTELLSSREYPGLKLTSHIFHDETHLSVIPATFSRGLRAVFNQG